jgi:hypothetical protein
MFSRSRIIPVLISWTLAFQVASPSRVEAGEVKIGGIVEAFTALYFQEKNRAEDRYGEIRIQAHVELCAPGTASFIHGR